MYSHVLPCIAMYRRVLPCAAIYPHVLPCIAMYRHVLACAAMYRHVLPCNPPTMSSGNPDGCFFSHTNDSVVNARTLLSIEKISSLFKKAHIDKV